MYQVNTFARCAIVCSLIVQISAESFPTSTPPQPLPLLTLTLCLFPPLPPPLQQPLLFLSLSPPPPPSTRPICLTPVSCKLVPFIQSFSQGWVSKRLFFVLFFFTLNCYQLFMVLHGYRYNSKISIKLAYKPLSLFLCWMIFISLVAVVCDS